jgi:AcrR family transcriptional regulator
MPTRKPSPAPEATKARILEAAMRCVERSGVSGMTMEDVAAESGMVRKTVYLAFGNRTALLDAVLKQRVGINVERVRLIVAGCATLDEAIVKGCIWHLQLLRKDKVLVSIIENAHGTDAERFLGGPASPVLGMMLTIWQEAFARARARGELRTDLDDVEIAHWLRGVLNQLLMRKDLSASGQEDVLRKFVLPALRQSAAS